MPGTPEKTNASKQPGHKPWWREPWPWIIMAGPAVAVVGCMITIVLAFQNSDNHALVEGAVKHGLVVTQTTPASGTESKK